MMRTPPQPNMVAARVWLKYTVLAWWPISMTAQRPDGAALLATSAAPQPARTSLFVAQVADALPRLLQQDTIRFDRLPPHDVRLMRLERLRALGFPRESWAQRIGPVGQADLAKYLPATAWMDSLRVLWLSTSTDVRARWLFSGGLMQQLTPALISLARVPPMQRALMRMADTSRRVGATTLRHTPGEALITTADAITGFTALARGDTSQAITALLAVACHPRVFMARPAARTLERIAIARGDTLLTLQALTLQRIMTGAVDSGALATESRLQKLYVTYTTRHGPLPDLLRDRLRDLPPPMLDQTLDTYLDRQWSAIVDRVFPVSKANLSWGHPNTRRVIVEYSTGPSCGGCWYNDRAMQPLVRRYPPDRVVLLTWFRDLPGTTDVDSLWSRYHAWYPADGFGDVEWLRWRTQHRATIPPAAWVSSTGDTLSDRIVDGHGMPEYATFDSTSPEGRHARHWDEYGRFLTVTQAVDRELVRSPEAALRIRTTCDTACNHVQVLVNVDTIFRTMASIERHPLAMRIVLYQDTLWIRHGTDRRIYPNVVRAASQSDEWSLGLPLPDTIPTSMSYTFDLAAIDATLQQQRDEQPMLIQSTNILTGRSSLIQRPWADRLSVQHPDPDFWRIDRTRLHVVAFVQDVVTGDILQAVVARVPTLASNSRVARK